jgi:hypothetical protein
MRLDILNRKDEILLWVGEKQSKAYICNELKCKPETLNYYLDKMGIEYSGNQGLNGIRKDPKRKSANDYANSTCVKSDKLKKKLVEDGVKENKCEMCGIFDWNGKPLSLELHHIDGNRFNNSFDNLQILCPNCHSQTDNYGSKNRK